MNSFILILLVVLAVIAIVSLLSLKDAFALSPKRIDNPLFNINNEDILTISKLQKEGRIQDAVSCAKELAKKQPNNLYNRYILGMSYLKNGQTREAVFQFEAVVKHQPDHLDTREQLADCYIQMKFFQRAALEYEYILKKNPDDLNVLKKAALIYQKIKNNKTAIDLLLKITMLDPEDTEALGVLSELYISENQYGKAIETLNYALNQKPNDIEYLYTLADLYHKTNRLDEAISTNLQLLEQLNPSDEEQGAKLQEVNKRLASLYESKECYDEALEYYNQIIMYDPKEMDKYGCKVAYIHFKQGREEDSVDLLAKMVEDDPNAKDAVALLAKIYIQKGNYEKAIEFCILALEKATVTRTVNHYKHLISNLYCEWGMKFIENNEKDAALNKFAESLKFNSQNAEVYYNIAIINHKNKDYSGAIAYLKKAIGIDPYKSDYYIAMGYLYDDLNNFDQAVQSFNSAIKCDPLNIEIKISKGVLLAKNRHYTEAVELFNKVVEADNENPDIYYNLALSYEYAGNLKLAYSNYEKALEYAPDHIEAKNNLDILKKTHNLGKK